MFLHNFKLFIRNIQKYKTTFLINIIGLSTGLTSVLLIALWVQDELSIDTFHEKDAQLFQVLNNIPKTSGIMTRGSTPGPLAKALVAEMPEVILATSVIEDASYEAAVVSRGDTKVRAIEQYAGEDFFNIFSYPLIEGNKGEILRRDNSVVISDEIAQKLFHTTQDLVGKSIMWNREGMEGTYVISGVFRKPPANSTRQFDLLFTYKLYADKHPWINKWENSDPRTYVVLNEETHLEAFNAKIENLIKSKHAESKNTLFIQKYADNYLYGSYENGVITGGRISYVKLFSLIALIILCLACINFMNLSTAKASQRLNEVGVKKAMGASRKMLLFQFFGESLCMAFFSFGISLVLLALLIPEFNSLTGKELSMDWDRNMFLASLGIVLLTGLMAGFYPALYLSGFRPIAILKRNLISNHGASSGRKILVITQFSISIALIVAVLVVQNQMDYIQSKNLGYEREQVIQLGLAPDLDAEVILSEFKKIPGVISATNYSHNLTGDHGSLGGIHWEGKDHDLRINYGNLEVGYDFIETLGIEILEGETFSRELNYQEQIIFNKKAIDAMGLKNPIGQVISLFGQKRRIVGIVKDFHFESLYEEVGPCIIIVYPEAPGIMLKMLADSEKQTLAQIENIYKEFVQGLPFEYKFLDETYAAIYESENRVGILSKYAAGIAILISCLGLFGLAMFTAESRKKEIGIRKTLGQSSTQVSLLLSSEFAKLVIVSIIMGLPIAYFVMRNWLSSFAYKIELEPWYFISAGLAALVVAMLTVSTQSIRAAHKNPVDALREE